MRSFGTGTKTISSNSEFRYLITNIHHLYCDIRVCLFRFHVVRFNRSLTFSVFERETRHRFFGYVRRTITFDSQDPIFRDDDHDEMVIIFRRVD